MTRVVFVKSNSVFKVSPYLFRFEYGESIVSQVIFYRTTNCIHTSFDSERVVVVSRVWVWVGAYHVVSAARLTVVVLWEGVGVVRFRPVPLGREHDAWVGVSLKLGNLGFPVLYRNMKEVLNKSTFRITFLLINKVIQHSDRLKFSIEKYSIGVTLKKTTKFETPQKHQSAFISRELNNILNHKITP